MLGWMLRSGEQTKYETFPPGVDGPFNSHITANQEYHYFRTEKIGGQQN